MNGEFGIIDLSQTLVKDVKLDSFVPLDVSFNDTFSKTEKKTIFSNDDNELSDVTNLCQGQTSSHKIHHLKHHAQHSPLLSQVRQF
jgi:hypothetical protein